MYIVYIPELDISSFFFFYKIFYRSYLAFPLHLEESIDINSGVNHLTHSPKDVSQILMALDLHIEVDHHHHIIDVLLDSIL
jgi:hypothetical protein